MKEIIAIIRMDKMNATKQALAEEGITSLTANRVLGRGKGLVDTTVLSGAAAGQPEAVAQLGPRPRFYPKRLLSIVVNDHNVRKTVQAILRVNCTGKAGDGKVFVSPIADAIRIRTEESGTQAVLEAGETIPEHEEALS